MCSFLPGHGDLYYFFVTVYHTIVFITIKVCSVSNQLVVIWETSNIQVLSLQNHENLVLLRVKDGVQGIVENLYVSFDKHVDHFFPVTSQKTC